MWSPWQCHQVTITTLHWDKNNSLLNNEHCRTVLGCCGTERPSLASRTGADDKLNLPPQVSMSYFQSLNRILPLFSFFIIIIFYLIYWKKRIKSLNISTAEADSETICIVPTRATLQDRSLPHICTHTKAHKAFSTIKFHLTIFPPLICDP